MFILETDRLIFRHLELSDLESLFALYTDPVVRRYFPEGTLTLEETRAELEWFLNGHPEHPKLGLWATIDKQTNQFIGRCGLLPWTIDDRPEVEVAYLLSKAFWGKGLATEAARAIASYGFEHLGLPRLICLIDPDNGASIKVAEKIGMTFEKRIEEESAPFLLYSVTRYLDPAAAPTRRLDQGCESAPRGGGAQHDREGFDDSVEGQTGHAHQAIRTSAADWLENAGPMVICVDGLVHHDQFGVRIARSAVQDAARSDLTPDRALLGAIRTRGHLGLGPEAAGGRPQSENRLGGTVARRWRLQALRGWSARRGIACLRRRRSAYASEALSEIRREWRLESRTARLCDCARISLLLLGSQILPAIWWWLRTPMCGASDVRGSHECDPGGVRRYAKIRHCSTSGAGWSVGRCASCPGR